MYFLHFVIIPHHVLLLKSWKNALYIPTIIPDNYLPHIMVPESVFILLKIQNFEEIT
jgi:hypothetical protein